MRKILLSIFILLIVVNKQDTIAQLGGQLKIDSLLKELPNAKEDTNKVNLLSDLAYTHYSINPDVGIEYGIQGLELAKKLEWQLGEIKTLNSLGVIYLYGKSEYSKSDEYFQQSLKIAEKLEIKQNILTVLGNIANNYSYQSNYTKSLEYFQQSLKIAEEIGDKKSIGVILGNIGNIYNYQKNYSIALEYYHKALEIVEELGDKRSFGINLGNIGIIYNEQGNYNKAHEYYQKALKISEEFGDKRNISINLGNLGGLYSKQLDFSKAFEYHHKALKIAEELGNKNSIKSNLGNIGFIYFQLTQDTIIEKIRNQYPNINLNKQYNIENAFKYTYKAIEISKEIGEDLSLVNFYNNLQGIYKELGDFQKAYEYLSLYTELKDSIFSIEKSIEFANLETLRKSEIKDKEIEILQTEKKAKTLQSYLFAGGGLVTLTAFFLPFFDLEKRKS